MQLLAVSSILLLPLPMQRDTPVLPDIQEYLLAGMTYLLPAIRDNVRTWVLVAGLALYSIVLRMTWLLAR
jgi:hypothetical protein